MKPKIKKHRLLILLVVLWLSVLPSVALSLTAGHKAAVDFSRIASDSFTKIRSTFSIFYGHTSHGGQIISGLVMLENENSGRYRRPTIHEADGIDLGDANWPGRTRDYLDNHSGINLVMWSWCGQLSWYTDSEVNTYLQRMQALETEYPRVTFVYMTGHLDGTGSSGRLQRNNARIRSYCTGNKKVLFDFADIESYDPNGNHYPNGSDQCEWCKTWCGQYNCPSCTDCAHSHCFNCYQKGKAFWWLLARMLGTTAGSDSSGCFIMTITDRHN